jgi:hypothetical protein
MENKMLTYIGAVLISLVSVYLGYRAGVKGERRKEFNEVSDRLRPLVKDLKSWPSEPRMQPITPEKEDLDLLLDMVTLWEKHKLSKAINSYNNAMKNYMERDQNNMISFLDGEKFVVAMKKLEKCLARK